MVSLKNIKCIKIMGALDISINCNGPTMDIPDSMMFYLENNKCIKVM